MSNIKNEFTHNGSPEAFHDPSDAKEDVLDVVGHDGGCQKRIFLILFVSVMSFAAHNLVMTFFAPNVDHWCARPSGSNMSNAEWRTIELSNNEKCFRLDDSSYNHTNNLSAIVRCNSWEYNETYYGSTLTSKFNLVCEREWFISLSKSVFNVGLLASATASGYASDRFGRRPTIMVCNIITVVSSILCAFSTSYLMFAICRFLIAVGTLGVCNSAFILLMETLGPTQRTLYGTIKNFGWSTGYVLLPGVSWVLKDWFWMQLVICLPSILLLGAWKLLPESPRWLLTTGQTEKACGTLRKFAKKSNLDVAALDGRLKRAVFKSTQEHQQEKSDKQDISLLNPAIRKITVMMIYLWFAISLVYYGIAYNTNELAGDPYLNFALSGAVEFPGIVLAMLTMRRFGRRISSASILLVEGVSCFVLYIVPKDPQWLSVTLSISAKMCSIMSFVLIQVYTAELFPTAVRNAGFGLSSGSARVASVIAPFARELGRATHPLLPQAAFGALGFSGGLLVLLLPETQGIVGDDAAHHSQQMKRHHSDCLKEDPSTLQELCLQSTKHRD